MNHCVELLFAKSISGGNKIHFKLIPLINYIGMVNLVKFCGVGGCVVSRR